MSKEEIRKVQMLPLDDKLKAYPNHPFKPYKGDRLNRLANSIKENGVIHPIIVQPIKDTFRIISGHNRVNAAKRAELTEIPAIIRGDLNESDADILVNESNIESRSFSTWLPSEKIKSINQYHAPVKNQGIRPIFRNTSGETNQKLDQYARQRTSAAYGESNSIIRLYIELSRLIEPLQDKLDAKDFGTTPASAVSFIPTEGQKLIAAVLDENKDVYKLNIKNSIKLREFFENRADNETSEDTLKDEIRQILNPSKEVTTEEAVDETVKLPIPKEIFDELFPDASTPEEAVELLIQVMEEHHTTTK